MSTNSQPISLEDFSLAVSELTDDTLIRIKTELWNSAAKLEETNKELNQEIDITREKIEKLDKNEGHDNLKEDVVIYTEALEENNIVLNKNRAKIDIIDNELRKRGLLSDSKAGSTDSAKNGVYL